ncbi:ATP-binding protein [Nostoc sp. CHAB 5834]|nr:ATP-binding protein [Nostoc sp. CHAB 5834]
MPSGIKPRVNEAREFLEIAKDFKDPREIIREALSNSWDANATSASLLFDLVPTPGTRKKQIRVTIHDNGEGMSSEPRPLVGSSEIEGFFNLGDSAKTAGSIGSKGHGTKIYYKSHGLTVDTTKSGIRIQARTETDPWASLLKGVVPTFGYDESPATVNPGTKIVVDGFEAKQSEFADLEKLITYIKWYTVCGSFGNFFGQDRELDVRIRPAGSSNTVEIPFGFQFPENSTDTDHGTDDFCCVFGPETLEAGLTVDGSPINVQIVGALLGENHRSIVPHTYEHMGLWLAKDFIRIERDNSILEDAFGGQYYYRNFLIFANCQQFDLTANRNNIRTAQDGYEQAVGVIKDWCKDVFSSSKSQSYFEQKKIEDAAKKHAQQEKARQEREQRGLDKRADRINTFKGRPDLVAPGLVGAPIKEPRNEAETALLLQAMISASHPGIDFRVGDYNTASGCDLLVEHNDKGFKSHKWAELVSRLDKLYEWSHHPDGYHMIVCYELGNTSEKQTLKDGTETQLVKKAAPGRYTLLAGKDTLEVYVLREILVS